MNRFAAVRILALVTSVALALHGQVAAGEEVGDTIDISGFLNAHSYMGVNADIESVIVWTKGGDGWILAPTGKGAELLYETGSEVQVKGVIVEYDDNGRHTVAVEVTEYDLLYEAHTGDDDAAADAAATDDPSEAVGKKITVRGIVRNRIKGNIKTAIIHDRLKGGWILVPDAKGELLMSLVGADVSVTGVIVEHDDGGRKVKAIRAQSYRVLKEAPEKLKPPGPWRPR